MEEKALFDKFNAISAKAWKQKIQYDLRGADYNDSLVWESPESIHVKPFYHVDDFQDIDFDGLQNTGSWSIVEEIFVAEATKANKKALDCLGRGAEGLVFIIAIEDIELEVLLAGIDLAKVTIYFNMHFLSETFVKKIHDLMKESTSKIYLNIDIIGNFARSGNWFSGNEKDFSALNQILEHNLCANTVTVDASLYQNAGANMVQQLAYALGHANEYLNYFEAKGGVRLQQMTFKISVGGNYFFEIAKIRALRLLWKTLADEYKAKPDCHIIATPSKRNKTLYDYNVNMLRTTTECMSAVLGGADAICNLRYDAIYHKNNEFGERIARNQLLVLKEEGYFDKVNNPADGTYYIESLTKQLAEKALKLFKNVEGSGGFLKQLKNHTVQKKIKESAQKEQHEFDQNKKVLVGTNVFMNSDDLMKDNLEIHPFLKTEKRKTVIEPILEKRLAEDLEKKRLKNE